MSGIVNVSLWPLWASGVRIPLPAPNDTLAGRESRKARGNQLKNIHLYVAVLGFLIILSTLPTPAHAAPTLRADVPLYTPRDKQVTLVGSGLTQGTIYYVWIRGPTDNKTQSTGISFTSLSGGLIPPGVVYPLSSDAPLGTYLVSLSTSATVDNSQATAHFGVWGTTNPLYQRTLPAYVMGGGLFPGTSIRLTIRDPAGNFVHQTTIASTTTGDFNDTWRVPEDAVTDVYTIFIDGTGTYDTPQQDYVSQSKFSVTQATLSAKITQQPNPSYQRTEQSAVSLALQYPDGSPVLKSKAGISPVLLLQDQITAAFAPLSLIDTVNGIWGANVKILVNATPSEKYRFELPAMSFDDGFGNKGGSVGTFSNYFQVRNASLVISTQVNGTQIQIPFGQVSIISKVTYPDGSALTNGTVRVVVATGSQVSDLQSAYDPTIGAWRASYSSTLSDLLRSGTWTLNVTAFDTVGNSGSVEVKVQAQPYLFIVVLGVLVTLVLFGRWTVGRYGRKVYFRVRKVVQRFRPGALG